jgi:glucose-6-phosphate 1-epimerase
MNIGSADLTTGKGGLPLVRIRTPWSAAEIYLHGAQLTGFQKNGEPPFLFLSRLSRFAPTGSIRGGVPICFPWFGNRAGGPSHGFARSAVWQLLKTVVAPEGVVTLTFALPPVSGRDAWKPLRTEFTVTVAGKLTMELTVTNNSGVGPLEIENCLHTYFHVGDIAQVFLAGLRGLPFDDFAAGATGARRTENDPVLRIAKETNRVYPAHTGAVEIHDASLNRTVRIEKSGSNSTVVWNPWTTQKLPDDFDPAEHQNMVCVESGNVKQDKITLAPGQTAALKVVLSSHPL